MPSGSTATAMKPISTASWTPATTRTTSMSGPFPSSAAGKPKLRHPAGVHLELPAAAWQQQQQPEGKPLRQSLQTRWFCLSKQPHPSHSALLARSAGLELPSCRQPAERRHPPWQRRRRRRKDLPRGSHRLQRQQRAPYLALCAQSTGCITCLSTSSQSSSNASTEKAERSPASRLSRKQQSQFTLLIIDPHLHHPQTHSHVRQPIHLPRFRRHHQMEPAQFQFQRKGAGTSQHSPSVNS